MTAGVSFRFGAGGYVDLPPGILKARPFGLLPMPTDPLRGGLWACSP